MKARLVDRTASPWAARAIPLISAAIALCAFMPVESPRFRVQAFFAAIAVLLGGPLVVRRGIDREVRLELSPGRVTAYSQDDAPYVLDASQIAAASTARVGETTVVSIELRAQRGRPLHIEVGSEDDARALHEALGLGRGMVGEIAWRTDASSASERGAQIGRGLGALVAALLAGAAQEAWTARFAAVGVALVVVAVVALRVATVHFKSHVLALDRGAVRVPGGRRVAYADLAGARARDRKLVLERKDGGTESLACNLPGDDLARLAAHVDARIASDEAPRSLPRAIASLARAGEGARDWLARLDALARTASRGAGYRESELDEHDLWSALRDPEAPADVRAGAARILLRVAPDAAPKRIESTLAVVHDPAARERIRIATDDDLDAAARDLERLDRALH